MIEIPCLQESEQTIYLAIPLALNTSTTTINEYHQQKIQVRSSDCLIISHNEMPTTKFQYYNTAIPLLYNDSETVPTTTKHKQHILPQSNSTLIPFTSLLVGPSYTCHALMQNYFQWAILQPYVFSSPAITKMHNKKHTYTHTKQNTTKNIHNTSKVWRATSIPKIWAQATLSHVKTTCMLGDALQNELRNIFSYPITVTPVSPSNHSTHNEMLAWLFTIYAVTIARKIFRTVLCDSSTIEHQFQIWQLQKKNAFHPLNKIIHFQKKASMSYSSLSLKQHTIDSSLTATKKSKTVASQINTEQQVLNTSEYHKRKVIYNTIQHPAYKKYIGFSSQHITTSLTIAQKYFHPHQTIVSIEKTDTNITISVPVLPCIQTQADIKSLVAHIFNYTTNTIILHTVALNTKVNPLYLHLHDYDIITALVFLICQKLTKSTRATTNLTLQDVLKLSLNNSIAICIELDTSLYSKKINISSIYAAIHTGYVIHEKKFLGLVEYNIIDALYSLLGVSSLFNREKLHWHIELLHNKENANIFKMHTSTASLPYNFHALIQQALENAFEKNSTVALSFPTLEHI